MSSSIRAIAETGRDGAAPGWRGIYPSLPTPFGESGELDLEGQRAVVRFALDAGAHGLICFGLAGEVFRLSPEERLRLLEVIVNEVNGRIPVLAGVGTEATHTSIKLAREAQRVGASGVVVPPPVTAGAADPQLLAYFERVALACDLPVMVQDAPEYLNVQLGSKLVRDLAERVPSLRAVKLEVPADEVSSWASELGGATAVFCGSGGLDLLDCLTQGAVGIAPGTDLVDLLVRIYDLHMQGDEAQAWRQYRQILPMLVFQLSTIDHYNACAKYVLRRRAVLTTDWLRDPALVLTPSALTLLDRHLSRLEIHDHEPARTRR